MGRRDVVVVKSTFCFCRGPEFNSQYPHGYSQFSVIQIPSDPMPFLISRAPSMHTIHRHTSKQNTHVHKIKF